MSKNLNLNQAGGSDPEIQVTLDEAKSPTAPGQNADTAQILKAILAIAENKNNSSDEKTEKLLGVLLARETRLGVKEAADETSRQAKEAGRREQSKSYQQSIIRKQKNCKHLKGGATKRMSQNKDYAVYHHIFIDKTQYIKCHLCSAKWRPEDTKEFLIRNNRSLVNHTRIGWAEAIEMLENSSNRGSRSEVPQDGQAFVDTVKTDSGEDAPDVQL